jgi:hypothetical protein
VTQGTGFCVFQVPGVVGPVISATSLSSSATVRLDSQPPLAYIACTGDRAISPDWQRAVAIETLRVRPYELPGGHSPFLSRRDELAELLVVVAGDLAASS